MRDQKLERPLHLDMDFGEALGRFIQTQPEEVEPPPGKARKGARPKLGAAPTEAASSEGGASDDKADSGAPDAAP